jgi:pyrimidine operon attenuation protein/uracil phosphoribosyltransferase
MKTKLVALNKKDMDRILHRMSLEILEKNQGAENLIIIGIKTRGVGLAKRIAKFIEQVEGKQIPTGALDISLYRDDLSEIAKKPIVRQEEIGFDITAKTVILVDDVLYTGRTIRAALDALMDLGRPAIVQLAVLIDRGHKQLPIMANYVGKKIATSKKEVIKVKLLETDGAEEVLVMEQE